jgi:TRAP-type C4-dicarboxylate transport system permease large subunit
MLCAVVWRRYRDEDLSHVRRAAASEIGRAFLIAIPAIALPFVIRAAVVGGVATATEVSTIGIVYSILAGLLLHRQFQWRRLYSMLTETAALSGAILLIIGAATGMAWALTQSGFSDSLAKFMTGLPGAAPVFLAVTIVAFVVLGSVLERIPAIVLFGPLPFPIAKQVGVHEVYYAMVVIPRDGHRLVRPALRRRILRSLRHQPYPSRSRHKADGRLHPRAAHRHGSDCSRAMDFDRLP